MQPGETQKFYAGRASLYERLFIRFLGWGGELESFFRKSDYLHPNARILDAGCGTGIITRILYRLAREKRYDGMTFHAFDLTQGMLGIFQHWVAEQGAEGIEMIQADVLAIETLPQSWKGYDLIVSSTMLEYLPGQKVKEALVNLGHLLGPEGRLLVFVTRRNFLTRWLAAKWWKTNVFSESEIASPLGEAGFDRIKFVELSPGWSDSIMAIEAEK